MAQVLRPEGFENEKKDCTIRALSITGNIPYDLVHQAFKQFGRKDGHSIRTKTIIQKVCKSLGLNAKQIKRSGTANKLIQEYPTGKIFCLKRGHAFAIINGVEHDLDSKNSRIKGAWLISKQ